MDVRESIAELYRVFRSYRIGLDFSGCPHCVDPRDSDRLRTTALKQLTPQDLEHYARKAMTTWGDSREFRHFLPRLFEIALVDSDGFPFLDLEILFGKLAYGEWETWPRAEQTAVNALLHAYWQSMLAARVEDDEL